MIRVVFALVAVLMLTASPLVANTEEYKKGYQLFKQGKYKEALPLIEEAMETHPDWYFPTLLMGQVQLRLGNNRKALSHLEDALTLELPSKDIPSVKFLIAKAYLSEKSYVKAETVLKDLVPIAPATRKFEIYYNLGVCQMKEGERLGGKDKNSAKQRYEAGIKQFNEALKHKAPSESLKLNAALQRAMGQYEIAGLNENDSNLDKAIAAFENVLTFKKNDEKAHRFIVNLHLRKVTPKKGKPREAAFAEMEPKLKRFLTHWPKDAKMAKRLAQSQMGSKQYAIAADSFRNAIKLAPNDPSLYFEYGSCLMADKKYKPALEQFERSIAKGGADRGDVYVFKAHCLLEQKNGCYSRDLPLYEKAEKTLQAGVKNAKNRQTKIKDSLQRTKGNLATLRSNLAADNENHRIALENVTKLREALKSNMSKLEINRERHIGQPTAELEPGCIPIPAIFDICKPDSR